MFAFSKLFTFSMPCPLNSKWPCSSALSGSGIMVIWALLIVPAVGDEQLKLLGNSVKDVQEASAVLYTLSQRKDLSVADVLRAMKGQNQISQNWYLSLAQSLADRNPDKAQQECQAIVEQLSEDSSARYWAFSFLTSRQPELKKPLLESMQSDPSPELRYEAIEQKLKGLEQSPPATIDQKRSEYAELLKVARLPAQVTKIAEILKEAESPVNLLQHFGFVASWFTIGPFDNVGQAGFNVVYDPEEKYLQGSLTADSNFLEKPAVEGKSRDVKWSECSTAEDDGSVNLQAAYNKEKGAVVYAFSSFNSPDNLEAQVRIGSPNAVKVWVNGKELISREVYHSGGQIDQYAADVQLNSGLNSILVKVCQNEQTEPWAQDWSFQLRFCDASGLAIQPVQ